MHCWVKVNEGLPRAVEIRSLPVCATIRFKGRIMGTDSCAFQQLVYHYFLCSTSASLSKIRMFFLVSDMCEIIKICAVETIKSYEPLEIQYSGASYTDYNRDNNWNDGRPISLNLFYLRRVVHRICSQN